MSSTNPKDAIGLTKPALRLVPPALALHVSQAMADGAKKYGAYNWRERDVRLTVYIEAAMRHLYSLLDGEDRARDSGHLHAAHVAACMAIILDAKETGNLIDDRPKAGPASDLIEALTAKPNEVGVDPTKPGAESTSRAIVVWQGDTSTWVAPEGATRVEVCTAGAGGGGGGVAPKAIEKVSTAEFTITLNPGTWGAILDGFEKQVAREIEASNAVADELDEADLDAPIPYWITPLPELRVGDVVTYLDDTEEGVVEDVGSRSHEGAVLVRWSDAPCWHLIENLRLVRSDLAALTEPDPFPYCGAV